jgi:hypothetical protein
MLTIRSVYTSNKEFALSSSSSETSHSFYAGNSAQTLIVYFLALSFHLHLGLPSSCFTSGLKTETIKKADEKKRKEKNMEETRRGRRDNGTSKDTKSGGKKQGEKRI